MPQQGARRPSVACCGMVRRPCHNRGLPCCGMVSGPCHRLGPKVSQGEETFGRPEWHGPETMPQQGARRPSVACCGDVKSAGHRKGVDCGGRGVIKKNKIG